LLIFVETLFAGVNEYNTRKCKDFLDQKSKEEGVTQTSSGLLYKVITKSPNTKKPSSTDQVKVHYAGTLTDGVEFDSSYKRGEPATFGVTQVIKGWTEALQLMSEGDKFELYIKPELGYGSRGAGKQIGPNACLVFTVELLGIVGAKGDL